MSDLVCEILKHAKTITDYRMPNTKATNGAHFALLKMPRLEREEIGTARFNYAQALRSACLGFRDTPTEARELALSTIQRLMEMVQVASCNWGR